MCTKLIASLSVFVAFASGIEAPAHEGAVYYGQTTVIAAVTHGRAQQTPHRPAQPQESSGNELRSGARVTLYANFLRKEAGMVLLVINDTSHACAIKKWRTDSVTIELPRLGLPGPRCATLQIVLPDGRIAKTFLVMIVPPRGWFEHPDSIPQVLPPLDRGAAVYLH